MARYRMRRHADGFAVVDDVTGTVAMANGSWLEGLDAEDASDLVDLINCVEGELLLDAEDLPESAEPRAARARAPRAHSATRRIGLAPALRT